MQEYTRKKKTTSEKLHASIKRSKVCLYTECKYGGPLGRPGSSCMKARLVRPQEFCWLRVNETIELLRAWAPPKKRFYSSWNYLYFPEIFS